MMFRLSFSSFILALLGCVSCAYSQAPLRSRPSRVRPAVEVEASAQQEETSLRFIIRNNSSFLRGTLTVNDGSRAFKASLSLPTGASSPVVTVPADYLVTGGNRVHFQWAAGSLDTVLFNWNVPARGIAFEKIELSSHFNTKLSQLFPSLHITDEGLRKMAAEGNEILLPQGIPLAIVTDTFRNNVLAIASTSTSPQILSLESPQIPVQTIELSGQASHLYILLAGTALPPAGTLNGEIFVRYAGSTADTLRLISKRNWFPVDSLERNVAAVAVLRILLKTGETIWPAAISPSSKDSNTQLVDGGAAVVLDLSLDVSKELRSLSLHTAAPGALIGLVAITLARN